MFHGFKAVAASLLAAAAAACGSSPLSSQVQADHGTPGGQLQMGRYVGWISLTEPEERIGVSMDAFIVQPEDLTQFPSLTMLFKLQLGGYGSPEYMTETFTSVRYDFDGGTLALDDPDSDLQATAVVFGGSAPVIEGDVFQRTSARSGTLHLTFQTDEPGGGGDEPGGSGGDEPGDGDDAPFMPTLAGQYEGTCDGQQRAAMQVVVGKDLIEAKSEDRGLIGYGIAARLAFDDSSLCPQAVTTPGGPAWCVIRNFSGGTFEPFSGTLILEEPVGTTACTVSKGTLACAIRTLDRTQHCSFQRVGVASTPYQTFGRRFHVVPTDDQRLELPLPNPPAHAALVAAVKGTFSGWLHNESSDRYLPMRLNVMATVSTANPHNENLVYVTPTATFSFQREIGGTLWSQRFDRRSLYLSTGFVLEGSEADGFLAVEEWRSGYIKGSWYSHSFGRVGTVELVKGGTVPQLPSAAAVTPPIAGEFQGPALGGDDDLRWYIKLGWPPQPGSRHKSALAFAGEMNLGGIIPRVNIANGRYDPYSGAVAWHTEESARPRMINGSVDANGDLLLIWPGAPIWGVPLPAYQPLRHRRLP